MRWLESSVRIELGVVEHEVERAVAQRSARRIKIEFRNCICGMVGRFAILCVEPERVESLSKRCCLQLPMYVRFAEEMRVVRRRRHSPISGNELRRMIMRRDDCCTMRYCSPSYSISIAESFRNIA